MPLNFSATSLELQKMRVMMDCRELNVMKKYAGPQELMWEMVQKFTKNSL